MNTEIKHARPPSLEEIVRKRKPVRNINAEHQERLSPLERIGLWITQRVGTMGFFLVIFVWTSLWLGWNLFAPENLQFDPPMGFIVWLFISNLIQIFLMPLIMVGQNAQGRHAELRAENDYQVNLKAEREIEVILQHLEYQNAILLTLVEKMGLRLEEIKQQEVPTAPAK
ncbi:MAG TPA: DUF1003 domain-containing protein [Candidatus Sumerlaeota bacterium]|nr:DUF1003 domain-containing protein [Candidatus Sumerlaeota bacterium]